MVPVVHLELHLGHVGRTRAIPDAAAIPVDLAADDVAGEPLPDAGQSLPILVLVAALQADDHLELLLVSHLGGREDQPGAETVDADRLLHEDVLASFHRRLEMEGAKTGGRGEDHQIAVIKHLLVAIEPLELPLLRAVDLVLHRLHRLERPFDLVAEGVGNGSHFDVRSGHRQRLLQGSRAAAATPDHADPDHIARRRLPMHSRHGRERPGHTTGQLEGVTTGELAASGHKRIEWAHRRGNSMQEN